MSEITNQEPRATCTPDTVDGHYWVRRRDGSQCAVCDRRVFEQKQNIRVVRDDE